MAITLRCPECGQAYHVRPDLAGKQAKCRCGAVMKVPSREPPAGEPAWEDEVNQAFGPATATKAPEPPEKADTAPSGPPGEPAPESPAPPEPRLARRAGPRGPADSDAAPRSWRSRVAGLARVDLRRLYQRDRQRAIYGLAAVAFGVVAAVAYAVAASRGPAEGVFFGATARHMAQAALAGAMAVGGLLILKEDRRGPACAGLAAVLYSFIPTWGLIPESYDALNTERFLPLLWVAVRYAVPIALAVWCLKEETRRQGEKEQE